MSIQPHLTGRRSKLPTLCGSRVEGGLVGRDPSPHHQASTWLAIYPVFAAVELMNIYRAAHDAGEDHATH